MGLYEICFYVTIISLTGFSCFAAYRLIDQHSFLLWCTNNCTSVSADRCLYNLFYKSSRHGDPSLSPRNLIHWFILLNVECFVPISNLIPPRWNSNPLSSAYLSVCLFICHLGSASTDLLSKLSKNFYSFPSPFKRITLSLSSLFTDVTSHLTTVDIFGRKLRKTM